MIPVVLALTVALVVPVARVQPDVRPAVERKAPVRPVQARGGLATWYAAPDGTAAAGPALRALLGRHWRGQWVTVTAGGHQVAIKLTDWCACGPRHGRPTLLDINTRDFARLAPPSRGVVEVRVR